MSVSSLIDEFFEKLAFNSVTLLFVSSESGNFTISIARALCASLRIKPRSSSAVISL